MIASTNLYFCKDLLSFAYIRGNSDMIKRVFCSIIATSHAKSRKLCNRLTTSVVGSFSVGNYSDKLFQPNLHPNAKSLSLLELLKLGSQRMIKTTDSEYFLACDSEAPLLPAQIYDYSHYLSELVKPNSTVLQPLKDNLVGRPYLMQRVAEAQHHRLLANRALAAVKHSVKKVATHYSEKAAQTIVKTDSTAINNIAGCSIDGIKSVIQSVVKTPNITLNTVVECPMEEIKNTLAIGVQSCKCDCSYDISSPLRTVIIAALLLTALLVVVSHLNKSASSNPNSHKTNGHRHRRHHHH